MPVLFRLSAEILNQSYSQIFYENTCHSEFVFAGNADGSADMTVGGRPRSNRRSSLFFQTKSSQDGTVVTDKASLSLQAAVISGDFKNLQIPSSRWIPKEDPMSYIGTWTTLDRKWAERSFQLAPAIEVIKPTSPNRTSESASDTVLRLKVIKAGLLSRKGMSYCLIHCSHQTLK